MSIFNNLNISPQSLGLLSAGVNLLEGQPFGQAVQSGLSSYVNLNKINEERKRQIAAKNIQDDLQNNIKPSIQDIFAASPNSASVLAAQQFADPKVYGTADKGFYTYERNPTTGKFEFKTVMEPQGLGLGTGFQANVATNVYTLGQKINAGNASPDEINQYNFLAQYATKPNVRQIPNADGTISTVEMPGIDLKAAGLPAPNFMTTDAQNTSSGTVLGTTPPKFASNQTNAASFANRMVNTQNTFAELTSGDDAYDPTNFQDYQAQKLPGSIAGFVASPKGLEYERAKRDFINAQLRQESGAAIGEKEFENAERQYFPIPGDTPAVIERKRKARAEAIKGMIGSSGGAYEALFGGSDIPAGAVLLREIGGVKYFKLPDGSIKAAE